MKLPECSASIVIYNNPPEMIRNAAESLLSSPLRTELHIVDNSPTQAIHACLADLPIKYQYSGSNLGYGRGHNRAVFECTVCEYHIVINPDIIIHPSTIETLVDFMNKNIEVGMVAPKVLNEDGSIQHLNKRYPSVFDLFARRFIPKSMHHLFQRRMDRYEMKDSGYQDILDVECVSGCFMLCRTDVLKSVGGFDDRYFMYFEDFDVSRKIQNSGFRTIYYPYATVTHKWERASHKSFKMTWVFIVSMCRYFNKWGWKWF